MLQGKLLKRPFDLKRGSKRMENIAYRGASQFFPPHLIIRFYKSKRNKMDRM
jgi:hypothetical protein